MTELALALDVGGTKVLGGLVTPAGEVRATRHARTSASGGADPGLRATLDVGAELLAAAAAHGTVVAVGAGVPEYVHQGRVRSHEVLAWQRQPAELLAAGFPGLRAVVESDVRCGALAEATRGAGAGRPSLLYVSWGTGLSSTLVLDGVPYVGHRGEAIALGEVAVPAAVQPTWPDNLERYASGGAVAARYTRTTGRPVDGAHAVADLARAGDQVARGVLETSGRAVGVVLTWLVAVLDAAVVVLGGGLGCADTPATEAARSAYGEGVRRRPSPPPLVQASLGPTAGLVGAALFAHAQSGSGAP